jgi:hypothetical protein
LGYLNFNVKINKKTKFVNVVKLLFLERDGAGIVMEEVYEVFIIDSFKIVFKDFREGQAEEAKMNLVVGTPKIPILKPQTIDDVFCYK